MSDLFITRFHCNTYQYTEMMMLFDSGISHNLKCLKQRLTPHINQRTSKPFIDHDQITGSVPLCHFFLLLNFAHFELKEEWTKKKATFCTDKLCTKNA